MMPTTDGVPADPPADERGGQAKTDPVYNAYYYAHDCGSPYERSEAWLAFFANVADWIVAAIAPRTVLDAGCAFGFLVEALRARGVDAWGIDVSDFAIGQVADDVKPYCRVGSILEPFGQPYDLIVTMEVLEHLSPEDGDRAIANLTAHSDDILFSSTPFDYREITHLNVQPPEEWARLFARRGFFHDVDTDAGMVTPWALRFRRAKQPTEVIVAAYERALWRMRQETRARRDLALDQRREIVMLEKGERELRRQLDEKQAEIERLSADLQTAWTTALEVEERRDQVRALTAWRDDVTQSPAWRVVTVLQGARSLAAPEGSRRSHWLRRVLGR